MEDPKVGEEKNAVVPIRRAPSFGVEARGEGEASPRREAKQPRDIFEVPLEDNFTKPLWIQLNTHDLLSFYSLIYHAVQQECNCPNMTAGPNFEFLWVEREGSRPVSLSAREYTSTLVQWADNLTNGYNLDPTDDEKVFQKTYRLIWSRSFRIAMHIYWHHWTQLTDSNLDALINAYTKHFVIFALKFKLLTSWESVGAIFDLLSSILPPFYVAKLNDLRDGNKKRRPRGARIPKEPKVIAGLRKRSFTEVPQGLKPPTALSDLTLPSPPREKDTALLLEQQQAGEGRPADEEMELTSQNEPVVPTVMATEGTVTPTERIEEAKEDSNIATGAVPPRPTEAATSSKIVRISPRDMEERSRKSGRIQMSKEEFLRELQNQKEQMQSGPNSANASPRSPTSPTQELISPRSPEELTLAEVKIWNSPHGEGLESPRPDDDEGGREGKRTSSPCELTEQVRRFFTPPGSPRRQSPESSSDAIISPKAQSPPSSASAHRRFPTIPPSFDVSKALADLTALDQEYSDFEEFHILEERLLSASRPGTTSLTDLFDQKHSQQLGGRTKASTWNGQDLDEMYKIFGLKKAAKNRSNAINQKEFEELRLQLTEQEKKRSRSWVAKRTSLPRTIQELKGSYITPGGKRDFGQS